MKLPPLSGLPLSAKLLVTCFLVTLAFGNVTAGIYTQKYVGISAASLVETYSERGREHDGAAHAHDGGAPHTHDGGPADRSGETPITLDQVREMKHRVDLKLLLQDAHVHLFSHGVLSMFLGVLVLWTRLPEKWKIALIPLPFLGGTLDFAGMFLVKYAADAFAYLIIASGALTGTAFAAVFFIVNYELWFLRPR
ncbi:MAG: hypothetical protein HY580_01100 [Nitrospinae bacterium]|nr:hypothetical protein [Nitrospinota bacterium]